MPHTLTALGRWLRHENYRFITPTPTTHARVNARSGNAQAKHLRDIFGWNRPFAPALLPAEIFSMLQEDGLLYDSHKAFRSRVRFSSLGDQLYVHSSFPTEAAEAVFFGPDSYRFVTFIITELALQPLERGARILDLGCGAGPGGIEAAMASKAAMPALVLADINPSALNHARANAQLASLNQVHFAESVLFSAIDGSFDLIVANPPYLVDATARTYRHGGGPLGSGLSERIIADGLTRLAPGGRLLLYTGVAMVDGMDPFLQVVKALLAPCGWPFCYRELDPDVFGEELDMPAYAHADRIAAVALVVRRPRRPESQ